MRQIGEIEKGGRSVPAAGIGNELQELIGLEPSQLKAKWRQFYGSPPPKRMSRDLMTRAIAYKLQEAANGGLKPATKRKLSTLVAEYEKSGKVRLPSRPLFKPGIKLIREWQGNTHSVIVLEDGFEFEGERYRSLSAIAQNITGAHWSGPRFFGIKS